MRLSTPKTFWKLSQEMRASRAHTYSSENAEIYRGFDSGQLRAAEQIEALIGEWGVHLEAIEGPGDWLELFENEVFILSGILGIPVTRKGATK
jgi:hypothetical protein